jgi:hypothetical protein
MQKYMSKRHPLTDIHRPCAECVFMTRNGHSRGAFVLSLFEHQRTVEPSPGLDFDRNPAFSVTYRRFTA